MGPTNSQLSVTSPSKIQGKDLSTSDGLASPNAYGPSGRRVDPMLACRKLSLEWLMVGGCGASLLMVEIVKNG